MQDINLLQNKLKDRSDALNRNSMLIIGVAAVITIAVLAAGGLFYFLTQGAQSEVDKVKADNASIQSKIDAGKGEVADAKGFQAQLQNIDQLAKSHIYWSAVFDEIQKSVLKKAQYSILVLSTEGKVHVEGMSDSYTDVGKLVLSLSTNPNIKDVHLASAQRSGGAKAGYNFSIDFAVNLGLVIKK